MIRKIFIGLGVLLLGLVSLALMHRTYITYQITSAESVQYENELLAFSYPAQFIIENEQSFADPQLDLNNKTNRFGMIFADFESGIIPVWVNFKRLNHFNATTDLGTITDRIDRAENYFNQSIEPELLNGTFERIEINGLTASKSIFRNEHTKYTYVEVVIYEEDYTTVFNIRPRLQIWIYDWRGMLTLSDYFISLLEESFLVK